MDKQKLVNEIRASFPTKQLLEVVSAGAVKVGEELIVLKNRPDMELKEEDMESYNKMNFDYEELFGKSIIFDQCMLNYRGKQAIKAYLELKEAK